jgi:glutathione peroxidase-family protein
LKPCRANYKTKTTDKQKIMPPTNQPTHADVVYSLLREMTENTNARRMCIWAFTRYALSKNLKGRVFNRFTFFKRKQLLFAINILKEIMV